MILYKIDLKKMAFLNFKNECNVVIYYKDSEVQAGPMKVHLIGYWNEGDAYGPLLLELQQGEIISLKHKV